MTEDRAALLQGCLFIAGPTAVGKTEVALRVAERLDGEIVGADAFQVYERLDILTAKPPGEALARVPHHLVATVPLSEAFNVARWLEAALAAIAGIRERGKTPIIVGGTGLYLRALVRGLAEVPPSDETLREELSAQPLEALLHRLETLDPAAAASVDRKNPRRVVRALEVCLLTGRPFSSFREEWGNTPPHLPAVLLVRDREELYERIDRRAAEMFAEGAVEEVRSTLAIRGAANAGGIGPTAQQVIGWKEINALLRGECTQAECIDAIRQATRRYAKRQLTWFRRETMFQPVSLSPISPLRSSGSTCFGSRLQASGLSPQPTAGSASADQAAMADAVEQIVNFFRQFPSGASSDGAPSARPLQP